MFVSLLALVATSAAPATAVPTIGCPPRAPTASVTGSARYVGPITPVVGSTLSTAVVTNDAPASARRDGVLAEVIPDDSGRRRDSWIDETGVQPDGRLPFSLACRYGKAMRGGQYATLLVPMPAGFTGTCIVATPQGAAARRRPVTALCTPER